MMKLTSPCVVGSIVALAIFSSMAPKTPVWSWDALIKVPELLKIINLSVNFHLAA